jgi:hypothetical protein
MLDFGEVDKYSYHFLLIHPLSINLILYAYNNFIDESYIFRMY